MAMAPSEKLPHVAQCNQKHAGRGLLAAASLATLMWAEPAERAGSPALERLAQALQGHRFQPWALLLPSRSQPRALWDVPTALASSYSFVPLGQGWGLVPKIAPQVARLVPSRGAQAANASRCDGGRSCPGRPGCPRARAGRRPLYPGLGMGAKSSSRPQLSHLGNGEWESMVLTDK